MRFWMPVVCYGETCAWRFSWGSCPEFGMSQVVSFRVAKPLLQEDAVKFCLVIEGFFFANQGGAWWPGKRDSLEPMCKTGNEPVSNNEVVLWSTLSFWFSVRYCQPSGNILKNYCSTNKSI